MGIIAILQSAAFAFGAVPAAPSAEVTVPQLECLADPQAEAAQTTYRAYIDGFSPETINGKKPDPELVALIDAEVARCTALYGWKDGSGNFAKLWTLARLMQSGAWQNLSLEAEAKDRLAAALGERGESGVALAAMVSTSDSARGYTMKWVADILEEADLADDRLLGEYLGMYMMGTYLRRYSREKFSELNMQEQE